MRINATPFGGSGGGTAQTLVHANCLATDIVGDSVYVTGAKIGIYYQVAKVNINNLTQIPPFGIIVAKASAQVCTVQTGGAVAGIYTGLTPQKELFVGTDGQLTETIPTPPLTGKRASQLMGLVTSTDEFQLSIGLPIIMVA